MTSVDDIKFDTCADCGGPIEIHRPPHDEFYSHLSKPADKHRAVPVALALLDQCKFESDEWFNAYNELRDKGDPSWDTFDVMVARAVELRIEQIIGRYEP